MVDSVDRERLPEAKAELYDIVKSDQISSKVPVLIFANKRDMTGKHSV